MVDTTIIGYVPVDRAGDTMTGDLILNQDPTLNLGAATKQYVDNNSVSIPGVTFKESVRVSSVIFLNATYDNGASGVGATLTNNSTLVALSIDGVGVSLNDRVLVREQANDSSHNGIYVVTTVGDGATPWVLTRSTGYNEPTEIEVGDVIFVQEGVIMANTAWIQSNVVSTIGTDPITFSSFWGAYYLIPGNGFASPDTFRLWDEQRTNALDISADSLTPLSSSYAFQIPSPPIESGFLSYEYNSTVPNGVRIKYSAIDNQNEELEGESGNVIKIPAFTQPIDNTSNQISLGSLHSPRAYVNGASIMSSRYVYNLGTGGTGTAGSFAATNDTLYCLPILVPFGYYNEAVVHVDGDASATADLEFSIFTAWWENTLDRFLASRAFAPVSVDNIGVTGEVTFNFPTLHLSGWYWLVFRADDIGTSLSFGTSSITFPEHVQNIFGGSISSDARSIGYGYTVTGQTSFPTSGATISASTLITSSIGVALGTV